MGAKMKFEIEEVVDHGDGKVEVRARLEDGALACLTLPKGDDNSYQVAVKKYLKETATPTEDAAS
jgi:hypothetical protein